MRRTEHLGARALTLVGLAAGLLYLVWRAAFSLAGTNPWLSIPALAVEVAGFLGALALAWALWPGAAGNQSDEPCPSDGATRPVPVDDGPVDVVVRVDLHPAHEVRATLVALRSTRQVQDVAIVDLSARPEIAALANEHHARYAASDVKDRNGLRVVPSVVRADRFLLLDAGDVPITGIVERLAAEMTGEAVAVVQGAGVQGAGVSPDAAQGGDGVHSHDQLHFERASLNPALGRRGNAIWLGSGSLVRLAALRDGQFSNDPVLPAQWLCGTALLRAGWRVVAPGGAAVVAHHALQTDDEVAYDRLQRARAARRLITGPGGALRPSSLTPKQRVSLLAWAVRPLSGLRRVLFLALVSAAILAGSAPFHATLPMVLLAWLPAFTATPLGLAQLSGGTLRPGDRSRWSLATMGAACRSLSSTEQHTSRRLPNARGSVQRGSGLLAAVGALSAVLVFRGVSDRVTHTLPAMPQAQLMGLMLVTLWVMGLSLDLLRVLARRSQLRSTVRVVSSLPATLGERTVNIVDLTAVGAGVISQTGAEVGERLPLDTDIPTSSGVTTVRVVCVVRNVAVLQAGEYRIGVELRDADAATADALAEFCTVEPAWELLGNRTGRPEVSGRRMLALAEPAPPRSPARAAVRFASLLALAGVVASAVPATADAAPSLQHRLGGVVLASATPPDPPAPDTASPDTAGPDSATPDGATADTATQDTATQDTATPDTATPDTAGPDTAVAPDTSVDATLESNLFPTTTVSMAGDPVPVPGVMVVAVCSLDAGPDGAWGTNDDTYAAPVSTITDARGHYELDLVGEACWASVSPPEQFDEPSATTGEARVVDIGDHDATPTTIVLRRAAAPAPSPVAGPGSGSIGDTVWNDVDGDGFQDPEEPGVMGVSLTLLDAGGHRLDGTHSDANGGFRFDDLAPGAYRISVANLPAGFSLTAARAGRDRTADSDADPVTGRTRMVPLAAGQRAASLDVGLAPTGAEAAEDRVVAQPRARLLPAPAADQVAAPRHRVATLSVVVVAFAALLALSILLGLVRPRRQPQGGVSR